MEQVVVADSVLEQLDDLVAEQRWEKHLVEIEANSSEDLIDKRLRREESQDLTTPFIIQPRIKNAPVSTDALALKDPAVALSVASLISLPTGKVAFHAEPDVVSIALAAQSAILAAGRIAEIGHCHYDAVEQIGLLKAEIEIEKGKAKEALAELAVASLRVESEARKTEEERARANAEEEKAKCSNLLRIAAKDRVNASNEAFKLAKEAITKLKANLEESKKAKEIVDSEISKAFNAGENAALEKYVEEVPKFENWGFKHG